MRSSISINRIVTFVIVAGYMFVNIRMQMVFFAGSATPEHNIWSKYQIATTWEDALRIGQDAYYAKTGWLVILLALQAFNVPFGLVRSTGQCNTVCSLSAGVSKPKVFRGR